MFYRHKQSGNLTITAFLSSLFILGSILFLVGFNAVIVTVMLVLVLCLYIFRSLTIEVNDNNLKFYFADGFWKKQIALTDIVRISVVKNPWYYGWGIRWIPRGWLYNVSGLMALEIEKRNGQIIRIGTDEPEKARDILEKMKIN